MLCIYVSLYTIAAGPAFFFTYTLKKDLPFSFLKLTRPSKAENELFVEQILQNNLRLDSFELKIRNLTNLFD